MRVRPPPSVRISRAAAFPGRISVKLSTSCTATYLLLTAVRRPRPLEVEVAPVSASRLLKKVVYPLSRSAAATCISCARVAIPVSWGMMAKPPSWGSMPVMRCSLSVKAAGPRRRRSVSRRDRSGGTRPLRRFHERSHRASPAVSSWSQLSRIGIAAGFAGAARASRYAASAEPVPSGAHRGARRAGGVRGARGASPAGMDPGWPAPPVPRGRPGCVLIAVCVVGRLGRGAPGVRGVPWGPPCPPLQDVGGRLLVIWRDCSVHRVPRQVFRHCPACVVLVCTQGAFRRLRGPSRRAERHRLPDGALRRWFEGQVGQWNLVRRQCAARGRRIQGSCRGRGPETPDGLALHVCLQPR